jgi:hypothetical protein
MQIKEPTRVKESHEKIPFKFKECHWQPSSSDNPIGWWCELALHHEQPDGSKEEWFFPMAHLIRFEVRWKVPETHTILLVFTSHTVEVAIAKGDTTDALLKAILSGKPTRLWAGTKGAETEPYKNVLISSIKVTANPEYAIS